MSLTLETMNARVAIACDNPETISFTSNVHFPDSHTLFDHLMILTDMLAEVSVNKGWHLHASEPPATANDPLGHIRAHHFNKYGQYRDAHNVLLNRISEVMAELRRRSTQPDPRTTTSYPKGWETPTLPSDYDYDRDNDPAQDY